MNFFAFLWTVTKRIDGAHTATPITEASFFQLSYWLILPLRIIRQKLASYIVVQSAFSKVRQNKQQPPAVEASRQRQQ